MRMVGLCAIVLLVTACSRDRALGEPDGGSGAGMDASATLDLTLAGPTTGTSDLTVGSPSDGAASGIVDATVAPTGDATVRVCAGPGGIQCGSLHCPQGMYCTINQNGAPACACGDFVIDGSCSCVGSDPRFPGCGMYPGCA